MSEEIARKIISELDAIDTHTLQEQIPVVAAILREAFESLAAQLAASNTDKERERQRHIKEMNLVLGTVNPLMIALGMNWDTQVAHLCNFAGDPDKIREAWRVASDDAMNRVTNLQNQLAAANAEIERLKEWKTLGGQYADCLQKLCMDRLYSVCKPVSHKWPGMPHVETIVEGVEFLLSEIERLRKIEAAAKTLIEHSNPDGPAADWGHYECRLGDWRKLFSALAGEEAK